MLIEKKYEGIVAMRESEYKIHAEPEGSTRTTLSNYIAATVVLDYRREEPDPGDYLEMNPYAPPLYFPSR